MTHVLHARPAGFPDAEPLRLAIDPGSASSEAIADLLSEISNLCLFENGVPLVWTTPEAGSPRRARTKRLCKGCDIRGDGPPDPNYTHLYWLPGVGWCCVDCNNNGHWEDHEVVPPCSHNFVDPTNKVVEANGHEFCTWCGTIKPPEEGA